MKYRQSLGLVLVLLVLSITPGMARAETGTWIYKTKMGEYDDSGLQVYNSVTLGYYTDAIYNPAFGEYIYSFKIVSVGAGRWLGDLTQLVCQN